MRIHRAVLAFAMLLFARAAGAEEPPRFHLVEDRDTVAKGASKHFLAAAGEIVLLEVGPWAVDRWVLKEDFAQTSWKTVRQNFRTGFVFDTDTFEENQFAHPYHGNLFFNAARSNGYSFWQSAPFALAGSLLWECCMENTAPSTNDLINTTLGGITRGEIAHRVSAMLIDNRATGLTRWVRELAGALYDPVGGFNRLLRGDMTRVYDNPDDRFPSRLWILADLGYRRVAGTARFPDKAFGSLKMTYGDPFGGRVEVPFQFFDVSLELSTPNGGIVSALSERGILTGWPIGAPDDPVHHLLGVFMHFDYVNNEAQVVGAQRFSLGLISVYKLPMGFEAATDAAVLVFPLEGVRTTDFEHPATGRTYEYAPGVGARVSASARRKQFDFLSIAYGVTWDRTVNGASRGSRLQYFQSDVRARITSFFALGAGYSWYDRLTTYERLAPDRKTQSEWRLFATFRLGDYSAKGGPPSKTATP